MRGDGAMQQPRALASDFVQRGTDALSGEAGSIAAAVAVGLGAALIEAELLPGILIGAGAMLVGKVFPQLEGNMRPMMKAAVGAGLALADRARGLAAEAGEQMRDVVAEVRAERQVGRGKREESPTHGESFDTQGAKPTHH